MIDILVVEDDLSTARLMRAILKHAGYHVHTADNGLLALELMDNQHIDLIVLDIMMPEMDGNTAIRTLQKMDPKVKIIACSGVDPKVSLANPGHADADLVLSKPYTGQDLLNSLHYILHKK